jgi:hypothetical protein
MGGGGGAPWGVFKRSEKWRPFGVCMLEQSNLSAWNEKRHERNEGGVETHN